MRTAFQGAIDRWLVADRAEVARGLGFARAVVSQLLDLLLLAPDIQSRLLELEEVDGGGADRGAEIQGAGPNRNLGAQRLEWMRHRRRWNSRPVARRRRRDPRVSYVPHPMPQFRPTSSSVAAAICEQVDAAKRGTVRIQVRKECLNCGEAFTKPLQLGTVLRAMARHLVGEVTIDVALIGTEGSVVGALLFDERYRKLEGDLKYLHTRSIPWLVALPASFAKSEGRQITWHPRRSSRPLCEACAADHTLCRCDTGTLAEERTIRLRVLQRISQSTQQPVPERGSPYWAEPFTCWKCSTRMLVYTWSEHEWMTDTPPPDPRPQTIEYRHSQKADSKYWVNVCPRCNSIQGDNYVFAPTGPLRRPSGAPTTEVDLAIARMAGFR